MFPMKNLSNEKDSEVRMARDNKSDNRGKKNSRVKKKSKMSPSKILNYKQAVRSRLTVKPGMFPQAIKTNILARNDRALHSPKISANEDIHQRLKNYNLNKLFHEEKPANEPFMVTPARNMLDESFRIASHQSHMSVTVSPSPQKNITLSDSLDYAAEDVTKNPSPLSSISITKEVEVTCMPSADFTYYAPQQAQTILLYQEVCQIVKKTIITEKVNHFGNFPDMVQEVRNKLWEIRSSRDENFNPDACSAIRGEATTFDPLSDDELCVDRSTLEFDSPMHDSNELKTPNTVDMAEAFTSSPFEFKLPQEPDRKNYRGRTECEAVVEDCAPTYLEKATKRPSPYRPKKSDDFRRKYQNSIFCSSLIPTCKINEKLTMNAFEFLDNSSDTKNRNSPQSNNEFDVPRSKFVDPSSELVDGRPPRRGPSNEWRRSDNVMGPVLKGNKQSNFEAPHRRDPRAIRNVDISMKHPFDCSKREASNVPEMAKAVDKNRKIISKSDYVFPSVRESDIPEMKYYPCRLY